MTGKSRAAAPAPAGRDREAAALTRLIQDATSGSGRVAVIRGPVAVGKTTLLAAGLCGARDTHIRLAVASSPIERRLPFGLINRLLHSAAAELEALAEAPRAAGAAGAGGIIEAVLAVDEAENAEPGPAAGDEFDPRFPDRVWRTFQALAAIRPLVIAVDDIADADAESIQCLLYLARRVNLAPIALLLAEQTGSGARPTPLRTELFRLPYAAQIRLDPLDVDGVAAVLAAQVGPGAAGELATAAHAASGGCPLLVRALAEDWSAAARDGQAPSGPAVGEAFAEAVVECLDRCGADAVAAARAVAVLGADSGVAAVAELAGLGAVEAQAAMDRLGVCGVLSRGRYRHPVARAAVLRDLPPAERGVLHRRAAGVRYAAGDRPTAIARHLVLARHADQPWAGDVLRRAADAALADGDTGFAIQCLEVALGTGDRRQAAAARVDLARAQWQLDPARAVRHLDQLTEAAGRSLLTGPQGPEAAAYLLWHGRAAAGSGVLDRLADRARTPDPETAARLAEADACLRMVYPARSGSPDQDGDPGETSRRGSVPEPGWAFTAMLEGPDGRGGDRGYPGPGRGGSPLASLTMAALVLAHPDQPAAAEYRAWLEGAHRNGTGVWQAVASAARADAALSRGDLPAAERLAAAALEAIPREAWGVVIGAPLACRLTASVEMGDYDEAAAVLAEPVPGAILQTPFGFRYLRARGHYQLAVGRIYGALADFQQCGVLVRSWGPRGPEAEPWWIDEARALVRVGRRAHARELLDQHAEHPAWAAGTGDDRTRGRILRQRAAAGEGADRIAVLTRAVAALRACGDRLELAYALADLGAAYSAAGDGEQARAQLQQAWHLARECQAHALAGAVAPGQACGGRRTVGRPRTAAESEARAELSAAEFRVGVLAARGLTNRQIASRLHITVSTVEQHLTHVYRKLRVKGRADLPTRLWVGSAPAGAASAASASPESAGSASAGSASVATAESFRLRPRSV